MRNYWKLRLSNIVIIFFAISPFLVYAQYSKPAIDLDDGERYIYPVNPGKPGSLAGTMGELRNTHFHSGIDIRTNNVIGFPVVASKSGYISRITTGPAGYGNIIYITHPDQHTTLYAHLDKFKGALAQHILEEQYKRKTSAVDLYFTANQFTVKQGDTIALSGNSGSSGGPHLHFDIRDPNNLALDPLKVANFTEVPDKLPPAPEKIALKTLDINSRINDKFGRFEFHTSTKAANSYSMASPILASGLIGIEIIAKDRLAPQSPFYGGVNYIDVLVDSQLVFSQTIDKIDVAETRAIYTLMDFKALRNRGSRFYKLYVEDGNTLNFYNKSPGNGKIKVNPDKESDIRITLSDSYGNKSHVAFKFRPNPVVKDVRTLESMTKPYTAELNENVYQINARACVDSLGYAVMYQQGNKTELEPDYENNNQRVYLIDFRKNIPDSVFVCGQMIKPGIKQSIPSGTEYKYYSDLVDLTFPENSLYDTLYLTTDYKRMANGTEIFSVGDRLTPLHKVINVSLKLREDYAASDALGVYRTAGKGYAYLGKGEWTRGRVNFSTREFGDFTVLKDLIPPAITLVNLDRAGARFKISDNLSGINSFEANINGEFLLMHYDAKTATIWSEKLNKKTSLVGKFELMVTDNAGNKNTFTKIIP